MSLVLAGTPAAMPPETLARVERAARELGYVPNRWARALRTRRTMTLACVVPDIANPFYPPVLRGLQAVAEEAGYDVISISTDGQPERERRFLDWARQGRVDGVAGVFFHLNAHAFEPLLAAGVAVTRIETTMRREGPLPLDNLYVDNARASAELVGFLLGRGHRRISMISGIGGPQEPRVQGYRASMQEAGAGPHVVLDPAFDEWGGARAARAVLAEAGERPTAIVAVNDLMAIGAMAALREAGLGVPDDVAVTGFDDIPAARLVTPALTTVSQFQEDLGRQAAGTLIGRLGGGRPDAGGTSREMPFRLVQRQST